MFCLNTVVSKAKHLRSLVPKLTEVVNKMIKNPDLTPEWMMKGKTLNRPPRLKAEMPPEFLNALDEYRP